MNKYLILSLVTLSLFFTQNIFAQTHYGADKYFQKSHSSSNKKKKNKKVVKVGKAYSRHSIASYDEKPSKKNRKKGSVSKTKPKKKKSRSKRNY